MCGKSSSAAAGPSLTTNHNSSNTNSTLIPTYAAEMRMDDYFFLDPLFIIGTLVLIVIIVIIVSWWLQRRKLLAEAREHADEEDLEKDHQRSHNQPSTKVRTVEITEKNLEVLEGLLSTVANHDGEDEKGLETESLLDNGQNSISGSSTRGKKHTTFGPSTNIVDGSNFGESLESNENEQPSNPATDKIITIIPDLDFRDFPKTEEDRMKMRRANMKKMLSLPPLT